jgi:DNA-binding response OmpR family regulator
MPDDGACVTIEKLRSQLGPSTVVISLIQADHEGAREICLEQGADDFVIMPCESHELSEVLMRHLPTSTD